MLWCIKFNKFLKRRGEGLGGGTQDEEEILTRRRKDIFHGFSQILDFTFDNVPLEEDDDSTRVHEEGIGLIKCTF